MAATDISKKTRDKSKKRKLILDGAIKVFIEEGYETASMDRVAETAGVSKRTVYNHFGSKENLFQSIVNDFLAERQSLKEIPYESDKSFHDQLDAFAKAELFLINSPERVGLSRLLTTVFLSDIQYARETVAKYEPVQTKLIRWLTAAKEDGKLQIDDPVMAARIFYAMVEGALTWPALFTDGIDEQIAQPMLDELIKTFLCRYGEID